MEISSYGVKILPTKLFQEEEKKLDGVDLGPETESMMSSKTTESVASIFQANADFIHQQSAHPSKKQGLYQKDFDPSKANLEGASSILLLDLRDPEEFRLSHIQGAINYPGPNIARDKYNPTLITYKNAQDKIIVCYTNDERQGVVDCQLLADKGWKNLYMLQGGFSKFVERHENFLSGKVAFTEVSK